jgi:DivIVA domain-containing protein
MAAIRLDHPVLASGDQIRRREFVTTRRGYDPDQVRAYLEELADQVDLMGSMMRESRLEAEAAVRASSQPATDPYERLAGRVASLIREADETADRLRTEARRDAERMIVEARAEADRIRLDAQAQAERARADADRALLDAHAEADRTISGLASRRESLVEQLAQMQERLLGVARDLEAAIVPAHEEPPAAEGIEAPERPSGATDLVVDVTQGADRPEGGGSGPSVDAPVDPAYEDLWDGTESIPLEMPEIPALDLTWDDAEDD